jgi:hypothetical protein
MGKGFGGVWEIGSSAEGVSQKGVESYAEISHSCSLSADL